MFGNVTLSEVIERQTKAVIEEALNNRGLGISSSAVMNGMPAVEQDFYYNEDNTVENFLRCGDELDSAGLGP